MNHQESHLYLIDDRVYAVRDGTVLTAAEAAAAAAMLIQRERDDVAYAWPRDETALNSAWDRVEAVESAVEHDIARLGADHDAAFEVAHAWIYSRRPR